MDSLCPIPNKSVNDCQNCDLKSLSLSDMISFGVPCCANTVRVTVYARSLALEASKYGRR